MAQLEDYLKDQLEDEITQADEQAEERREEPVIPERFKGKSAEEIAQSYIELESTLGKQSQELGHLRKTVDLLLEKQPPKAEPEPKVEEIRPLTVDDLYEDADASVRRVARAESQTALKRVEELERRLQHAELEKAQADFMRKHPDYTKVASAPDFVEWIKASPYRGQQAAKARDGDLAAADDLLTTYAEVRGVTKTDKAQRRRAVEEASLESSSGSAPTPTETYSKSKLQALRVAARRGDSKAEAYLAAHSDAILAAYAEGRLSN